MDLKSVVCRFESNQGYHASADGAVPGLLNQVMGVRISPEAPICSYSLMAEHSLGMRVIVVRFYVRAPHAMPHWTNLVKSSLSKGEILPVRIGGGVPVK